MGFKFRHEILFALILFFSASSYAAENISLNLETVRLYDLVKIAYSEQGTGYITDADLLADSQNFSLDLHGLNEKELRKLVDGLLLEKGYVVKKDGKHFQIRKTSADNETRIPFFYRPKYRPVNYITDMIDGLFQKGRFTFQAGLQPSGIHNDDQVVNDKGTSAYSLQQKTHDAFLFMGTETEIGLLKTLLADLDKPEGEVMVKAYLYEVTNNKSEGSAFNAALNLLSGKIGLNIAGAQFGNSLNVAFSNVEAVFSAFNTDNRFKVISSPSLRVKDGSNANFTVGAEVPVLGSVTTQNNGATTQSVDYRSSGTILDISPIIRDESIQLTIRQQVSNFIRTTSGVDNTPTLIKRELSSVITSKDGDLILIGGLDESTTSSESNGLSWLPRFLRTNTNDDLKTDILLVLHVSRI